MKSLYLPVALIILFILFSGCAQPNASTGDQVMQGDTMQGNTMAGDVMNNNMQGDTTGGTMGGGSMMDNNPMTTGETKTFVLTGENYKFLMDGVEAPELRVKQGDTVRIELTSTNGFHDWTIDEFHAATARVNTGETASVEFVADQKGTFEYYCSVGQHRAFGMKGNLVVE